MWAVWIPTALPRPWAQIDLLVTGEEEEAGLGEEVEEECHHRPGEDMAEGAYLRGERSRHGEKKKEVVMEFHCSRMHETTMDFVQNE